MPRNNFAMRVKKNCANCGQQKKAKNFGSPFCDKPKCSSGGLSQIFAKLDAEDKNSRNNSYQEWYIHKRIEVACGLFETLNLERGFSNKERDLAMVQAMDAGERLVARLLKLENNSKKQIIGVRVGMTHDIDQRKGYYESSMFQGVILHEETSCLFVAALGEITSAARLYGLLKTKDAIELMNVASSLGVCKEQTYRNAYHSYSTPKPGFLYVAVIFSCYSQDH